MSELDHDILAFKKMESDLKAHHEGKWVVIQKQTLIGAFDTFDAAAEQAIARFGRGPYLIRQVNAPEFVLPASVAYRPVPQAA